MEQIMTNLRPNLWPN